LTSTVPFRWVATLTVVAVYPVWQVEQSLAWGWGAAGGRAWQVPQALAAGAVQVGA
jgi:hypothetical protein